MPRSSEHLNDGSAVPWATTSNSSLPSVSKALPGSESNKIGICPLLIRADSCGSSKSTSTAGSSTSDTALVSSRTIFNRYWDVTNNEKRSLRALPKDDMYYGVTYEEALIKSEFASVPQIQAVSLTCTKSIKSTKRRSIFNGVEALLMPTEKTLYTEYTIHPQARIHKALSTSLLMNKLRPCLRTIQSYTSGIGRNTNVSGQPQSGSVSFSSRIHVYEFQKPREFHDPDAWVSFFT